MEFKNNSSNKLRLFHLQQIFLQETDDLHGISCAEIETMLKDRGISTERKTIYSDINSLRQLGIDIVKEKIGRTTYYHIGCRDFELPELKLLVDLVQSSKFITKKKSESLIQKLSGMASRYEATQLNRQVFITGRVKAANEKIYYTVDVLHTAINNDTQVLFHYCQWATDKKMHLKRNGEYYIVSPWALTWDSENYYLIGYDNEKEQMRHYRVDKIVDIKSVTEKRIGRKEFKSFDMASFTRQVFGMYDGVKKQVKIKADNSLIGVIVDRFGRDVKIETTEHDFFYAYVDVVVSDQFLGWVFGLGVKADIVEPVEVVEEFKGLLVGKLENIKEMQ